jgi:hypothetical protein
MEQYSLVTQKLHQTCPIGVILRKKVHLLPCTIYFVRSTSKQNLNLIYYPNNLTSYNLLPIHFFVSFYVLNLCYNYFNIGCCVRYYRVKK